MPFKIGSTSSKPFRGSAAVKYMTVGSTLVQPDWTLPGADTYSQFAESIARTNASATVADEVTTPTGTYPGSTAFAGGVLLPDGRVFCVPRSSTSARVYDPVADTLTTPTGTYPGSGAFIGGVLLPDGRVFCVPHSSTTSRVYDPVADTLTTPTGTYPGSAAFIGGVVLPDGRVYCVPFSSTTARLYGGGQSYNINVLLSAYLNKF